MNASVVVMAAVAPLLGTACGDNPAGRPGQDVGSGGETPVTTMPATSAAANDDANEDTDTNNDGADSSEDSAGESPEPEAPFELPNDEVTLLPFPVRMTNLALVVGVSVDNPVFDTAFQLRILLGDHDYSQQAAPDLRWTADRMYHWVRALAPICNSQLLTSKYPDLAADPSALMRAAYGRDPSPEEVDAIVEIAVAPLPVPDRSKLACLAVLSSLDFVAY
ncbi:MAG: hypothetical protein JKY37_29545 [Nannocystaceae bacterium]|nr:hypothetical protein [Nannocystaceae bacterium]